MLGKEGTMNPEEDICRHSKMYGCPHRKLWNSIYCAHCLYGRCETMDNTCGGGRLKSSQLGGVMDSRATKTIYIDLPEGHKGPWRFKMYWPVQVDAPRPPAWSQGDERLNALDGYCEVVVEQGGVTFHECEYHRAMLVPITALERRRHNRVS